MKTYILSLVLLVVAGVTGTEKVQAQNSSLSVNDCLSLLTQDDLIDETLIDNILENKGFVKNEINEDKKIMTIFIDTLQRKMEQ